MGKQTAPPVAVADKIEQLYDAAVSYREGLAAFSWSRDNHLLPEGTDVEKLAEEYALGPGCPDRVRAAFRALLEA